MDGSFPLTSHAEPTRNGRTTDRWMERQPDTSALMTRVKASRDREAFRALFLHFAPRVKTYLIRQGASVHQAEELAQEALLVLWREAERFDPARASVSSWVFTIARNLRIDALRRERSALAYALAAPEPEAEMSPEAASDIVGRDGLIQEAMNELPQEQRDLIRRAFFLDMPHTQIARDLTMPLGTVKSRIRLALKRLRLRLSDLT